MPRLNTIGNAACPGSGSGIVSIDGAPLQDQCGDAGWLTDDECAYIHHAGGQLLAYHRHTLTFRELDHAGANWLRAGDGVWAAWLNGQLRTNLGSRPEWAGKYLCDVAQGLVLLTSGSLQNIEGWRPNGQYVTKITTGILRDDATTGVWVRLRGKFLLWGQQDGTWHAKQAVGSTAADVSIVPRTQPVYGAVPIDVDGVLWIAEHCGADVTLRPANSTQGYVVFTGNIYGLDAQRLGPVIRVTWATAIGQPPDALRVVDVDLSAPRTDLNAPPVETMPPLEAVVPPRRPYAFLAYTFTNRQQLGIYGHPIGDILIPIRPDAAALVEWEAAEYLLVDTFEAPITAKDPWAFYTDASTVDDARDITEVGLLVYFDGRDVPDSVLEALQIGDALAFPAYLGYDESVADYKLAIQSVVDTLRDRLEDRGLEEVPVLPVIGVHLQIDDAHPVGQSPARLAQAFIACSELSDTQHWFGAATFRQWTKDQVPVTDFCLELTPYLERFAEGVTALVLLPDPAGPPDPGPGPDPGPDPDPGPGPSPVPPPKEKLPMNSFLRHRLTKMVARVDPAPRPGESGDHQWPVNWDKNDAGPHETGVLFKDGETFVFRFDACQRVLALNGSGAWETRADPGGDEHFLVTEQPEGPMFLYRSPNGLPVELCEIVEIQK